MAKTPKFKTKLSTTIDAEEIERFDQLSDQWWDEGGKYGILHDINPLRIGYIKEKIEKYKNSKLEGKTLLDVGCGGGLISLPMARLGAKVTGIDASANNIAASRKQAKEEGIDIDFMAISSEQLMQKNAKFDIIIAMEIIEHVADVNLFMSSLAAMLKPGGLLFISTINRNYKSLLTAKFLAEYVLRFVPIGTHEFSKFITPKELEVVASKNNLLALDFTGMVYKPLSGTWKLDNNNLDVNYIALFQSAGK